MKFFKFFAASIVNLITAGIIFIVIQGSYSDLSLWSESPDIFVAGFATEAIEAAGNAGLIGIIGGIGCAITLLLNVIRIKSFSYPLTIIVIFITSYFVVLSCGENCKIRAEWVTEAKLPSYGGCPKEAFIREMNGGNGGRCGIWFSNQSAPVIHKPVASYAWRTPFLVSWIFFAFFVRRIRRTKKA